MKNARLDEPQAGIKIAGRNIKNLKYATLMAESEEKLKSLLMRVKEKSETAGLNSTFKTVTDFLFLGSRITGDGDCSHKINRCFLLGRKADKSGEHIKKQ